MSFPRIFLIVPGLLAGLLIPAVIAAPKPAPPGTVGMRDQAFARTVVTIRAGQRLTLVNDSRLVHVVGPGRDGHIRSPAQGVPILGWHLMQTNGAYTTPPWRTPGRFHLTCSVHPEMNLIVVVTR